MNSVAGIIDGAVAVDGMVVGEDMSGGMPGDMYGEVTTDSNGGSLLSSWAFVGGITAVTLAISIVLGILLAKKRIKKGFDLYED